MLFIIVTPNRGFRVFGRLCARCVVAAVRYVVGAWVSHPVSCLEAESKAGGRTDSRVPLSVPINSVASSPCTLKGCASGDTWQQQALALQDTLSDRPRRRDHRLALPAKSKLNPSSCPSPHQQSDARPDSGASIPSCENPSGTGEFFEVPLTWATSAGNVVNAPQCK